MVKTEGDVREEPQEATASTLAQFSNAMATHSSSLLRSVRPSLLQLGRTQGGGGHEAVLREACRSDEGTTDVAGMLAHQCESRTARDVLKGHRRSISADAVVKLRVPLMPNLCDRPADQTREDAQSMINDVRLRSGRYEVGRSGMPMRVGGGSRRRPGP